jgi:hypothetical protein
VRADGIPEITFSCFGEAQYVKIFQNLGIDLFFSTITAFSYTYYERNSNINYCYYAVSWGVTACNIWCIGTQVSEEPAASLFMAEVPLLFLFNVFMVYLKSFLVGQIA